MSVTVYKTDAIIITDYKSIAKLVEWAGGEMAKGLVGKKVVVAESSFGWTVKKPKPYQQAIMNLFFALVAQSKRFDLDFVFILNNPEYLDPRLKVLVDKVKELG